MLWIEHYEKVRLEAIAAWMPTGTVEWEEEIFEQEEVDGNLEFTSREPVHGFTLVISLNRNTNLASVFLLTQDETHGVASEWQSDFQVRGPEPMVLDAVHHVATQVAEEISYTEVLEREERWAGLTPDELMAHRASYQDFLSMPEG